MITSQASYDLQELSLQSSYSPRVVLDLNGRWFTLRIEIRTFETA